MAGSGEPPTSAASQDVAGQGATGTTAGTAGGSSVRGAGASKPGSALKTTLAPPLHTSGNQIVDASGSAVSLRGVVLNGLERSASAPEDSEQAVAQAKAWGANFVRVPLGEQYWVVGNCDYAPGYVLRVDQVVNWITSRGMLALLDLHWNTVTGCEPPRQHNMADENESPTFWQEVASRYAANPLVAFDLYNEPHDIPDQVWLDGGWTNDGGVTYQAAGMQQLYDVVRGTGATNLVFATGQTWGNTVPSVLVRGGNIVYAAHAYTCPGDPPPKCGTPNPDDPSRILDHWVPISRSLPVAITEFGWPTNTDGTYNANVIAFAHGYGWGWTAFAWEQANPPSRYDLCSWGQDGSAQPTASGYPVLAALRSAP